MKNSQKISTNESKNQNSYRNKDFHQFNSKINKKPLSYKENTKQNTQIDEDESYYYKNKNKKNDVFHIQPIKSASIPNRKKIYHTNNNNNNKNVLSEENLINLMNKYINYSMSKNKKKKIMKNSLTTSKNHNLEENKENNNNDDTKKMCMESLIKKGIITEIKDLQKPKRETLKEKLTQKKKSFLEDIGIEPNNITSFQDSSNDKSNNNNNNHNHNCNYRVFTGICSHNNNKGMKYYQPKSNYDLYLYDEESSTDKECKKTPLKPKINQFEYIRKIKKERSKIQTNPNYISVQPENPTSKLKIMKISTCSNINGTTLNDSFRHKNEKNKKINCSNHNHFKKYNNNKLNIIKIQKYSASESNENKKEFAFVNKKTYRTPEELNKYMKNKKMKDKEDEEKKINKKNKELFLKYKNLCTLNNNCNDNFYKKYTPDYYNTISTKYKTHTSGFGLKEKKRENNRIILGNESFKNNNSTLIDANEYYLNILESKKLIIKNVYSKTETHFYNNKSKNENEKELKNIDEFFINNKKNNKIQTIPNVNNIDKDKDKDKKDLIRKISKKINDTLIKAKKIFAIEENTFNNNNNNNEDEFKEKINSNEIIINNNLNNDIVGDTVDNVVNTSNNLKEDKKESKSEEKK